jgi:hypothetical protein
VQREALLEENTGFTFTVTSPFGPLEPPQPVVRRHMHVQQDQALSSGF